MSHTLTPESGKGFAELGLAKTAPIPAKGFHQLFIDFWCRTKLHLSARAFVEHKQISFIMLVSYSMQNSKSKHA
jgi:hypothetical protein